MHLEFPRKRLLYVSVISMEYVVIGVVSCVYLTDDKMMYSSVAEHVCMSVCGNS